MMKKYTFILIFGILALLSCSNPFVNSILPDKNGKDPVNVDPIDPSDPDAIMIKIVESGNVQGDSVTASPAICKAGNEISLVYNVAKTKLNNRLVFSGTKTAIEQVDSAGSGSKKYIVNKEDSTEGVITINAVFAHSDKELDTIAFADTGNVIKTLGDAPFTRTITNSGKGTGAISYASSDPDVAEVNSVTGEVTILYVGTTEITATKAADAVYEKAEAVYTLTIVHKVIEVPRTTIIDFEADVIGKTYGFTKGGSSPTVTVVTDPIRSGQKSVKIVSSGYNQAVVIPINLPFALENYKSFSFKFSLVSGDSGTNLNNQSILVYAAKAASVFKDHGFGNEAGNSGNYPEFAANLLGKAPTPAVNFDNTYKNKWTEYTITINNPGAAIKDLKGDIYIAIGINCQNAAEYLFDDITFRMKDDFNPPPIIVLPAPRPPSTGAVLSGNYRNMLKEWGKTDVEITAKVNATWNKLFNGSETEKIYYTVGSDMAYILDSGNNDVRSEGMSYGMMMCVQLDKKTEFDRLWKWAKTYMYNTTNGGKNGRGYFAWQCGTDGSKKDVNPAADGEFYFVTSLLFASARWGDGTGDFDYGKWARQVLYDMLHRTPNGTVDPYSAPEMFNKTHYMVNFTPYGSDLFTDPSYHLPAFFDVWALELENDWKNNKLYDTANTWKTLAELKTDIDFYKQAAQTSRAFFPKTTNASTGLGPDYANFDGTPRSGEHGDFRYDAWRIAMNIAVDYAWWAADSWQKTFADRIQAFFYGKGVSSYGNLWTLSGTQLGADHSPGLVACNAAASLAATNVNAWKFIENFWDMTMTSGQYRYYDGCLYMLGLLHVSGNFKAYLSSNTTPVPSSVISPTSATFDKKTALQADISVTMTLNGNTLTNIKNGAATLVSNTDYTVSGTTVTIKKGYLAAQSVGTTTLTFTFSAGSTQNLVITVADTSNSSISPATAIFDKRADLQADINVTMTLNGNTLTGISNGGTTLTSGTDYSVSGSGDVRTVTINISYLSTLAVGPTTLTFTFNTGAAGSLAITVKESPAGGGTGTSYDFANDTFLAGYPKYSGTGTITASITGGVLRINKSNNNHSTPWVIISFNLGTENLNEYSSIIIRIRGVSDDYTNKGIRVYLGSDRIESSGNASLSTTFQDKTLTLTGSRNATGSIELGFGLEQSANYTVEIESIQLIK
jgi:endo-1,4-beta-D-glucanase Y